MCFENRELILLKVSSLPKIFAISRMRRYFLDKEGFCARCLARKASASLTVCPPKSISGYGKDGGELIPSICLRSSSAFSVSIDFDKISAVSFSQSKWNRYAFSCEAVTYSTHNSNSSAFLADQAISETSCSFQPRQRFRSACKPV